MKLLFQTIISWHSYSFLKGLWDVAFRANLLLSLTYQQNSYKNRDSIVTEESQSRSYQLKSQTRNSSKKESNVEEENEFKRNSVNKQINAAHILLIFLFLLLRVITQ